MLSMAVITFCLRVHIQLRSKYIYYLARVPVRTPAGDRSCENKYLGHTAIAVDTARCLDVPF